MSDRHRIPVIDRMMDVLAQIESGGQPTIRALCAGCGVPRTTVYRILNTLEAHGVVTRKGDGYQLGARLLQLSTHVPRGPEWQFLAERSQPLLQQLAAQTGQTAKLSVLDADSALVVAGAQGPSSFVVVAGTGNRFPLHAGAASKLLLAGMDAAARSRILERPLARYTARTITDPAALRAELAAIVRQGWAEDSGEFSLSVRAVAAPVHDAQGRVVAAISIAHLADLPDADRHACRGAVCSAAAALSAAPVG